MESPSATSFAHREFYRLNSFTTVPKTSSELARLSPTAATAQNYSTKNRYADVLPLEQTRVRLRFDELGDLEGNDYINASHVGYGGAQFICTQAPLPSTFLDFWQMVWEQNSPIICSLNREFEKGVLKGDVYWPLSSTSPLDFGHFRVSLDSVLHLDDHDLTIRYLTLLNKSKNESRRIVQMQFLGWPDKGVPKTTKALRELLAVHSFFRDRLSLSPSSSSSPESSPSNERFSNSETTPHATEGPTIAHCSAGVGRTGVFVALALLLESVSFRDSLRDAPFISEFLNHLPSNSDDDFMSIPGYYIPRPEPRDDWQEHLARFGVQDVVKMLRQQRNAGMVQTEDQYSLIYSVLRDTIVDEAHKDSRAVYHFSNSEVIKIVSSLPENCDGSTDRRSSVAFGSVEPTLRKSGSMSAPFPRRQLVRKQEKSRKRQIDWDSDDASASSVSSSSMDIDSDSVHPETERPRRRKIARTFNDSPSQEDTILNFS